MEGKELLAEKSLDAVGNSDDITIVVSVVTIVVLFVLYILKDKEKNNNKRHQDNETQIKQLATIAGELKLIIVELKGDVKNNTKDIEEVKTLIKNE